MTAIANKTQGIDDNLLAWALYYEELGFSVVAAAPGTKHPKDGWRKWQNERPSADLVRGWWSGLYKSHGIALVLGQISGGIFVVDVDIGEGKVGQETLDALCMANDDLPETWTARTGGGGLHYFFKAPKGVLIKTGVDTLGDSVDTRGDGGVVIAPPSRHPANTYYEWVKGYNPGEIKLAEAPAWLLEKVRNDKHAKAISAITKRSYTGGAINDSAEIKVNWAGRVIDGRDTYMRNIIWAVLIDQLKASSETPTIEEMFELCWPTFEAGAKPRGESLEEDGHTKEKMRGKLGSTLQPGKVDQARAIAEGRSALYALPDMGETAPSSHVNGTLIAPETEIEPTNSTETEPTRSYLPDGWYTQNDLAALPPLEMMVEDLLTENSFTVVYGKWGSFKSFLALDLAMSIARGLPWHSRATKKRKVAYICGEGKHGIGKRLMAWCAHHGQEPDDNFVMRGSMPRIMDPVEAQTFADEILAIDPRPDLIIIDTVSRALAGGDENDSAAMGHFVAVVDSIRKGTDLSVILIHHEGKNADAGPRGSTVLPAAADTMIQCVKVADRFLRATVTKQKDIDFGELPNFEAKVIEIAQRGLKAEESLVLVSTTGSKMAEGLPPVAVCREILDLVKERWDAGDPLNGSIKDRSKYLPTVARARFDVSEGAVYSLMKSWQETGCIVKERTTSKPRITGFRFVKYPG